ncbi:tyrosine-type recombinase/integrase [Rummeliibacillus pycnus]|uniref:tyrosine-type recombinase/integrase n=1 Tax=Rummeliibacillus pycnus TaxID=101070 RepID=UPI0037CC4DEB
MRTPEEIKEFKDALLYVCTERDWFMFVLVINTGLRISDLIKLKVGDIRGKSNVQVIEEKRGKVRKLFLGSIQNEIIQYCEGKADEEYLFPSKKGDKPISTTQAYRVLDKVADWLGREDIGTHTMRKTFGYHYYKQTKDVATLMEIFGHSHPKITKVYIGINDDEIENSLKGFKL